MPARLEVPEFQRARPQQIPISGRVTLPAPQQLMMGHMAEKIDKVFNDIIRGECE